MGFYFSRGGVELPRFGGEFRACERLIGALCMEWSEEWITGRRYLDMTDLK